MAGRNVPLPLYVTCPYDSNHRLAPRRYSSHIDKCARQSKKVLSICRYNAFHRIEPALLAHHYAEECADKPLYEIDDWDTYQPPKKADTQSNEVGALADALEAAAISDPPAPTSSTNITQEEIDDWDSGERHNFLAPEFNPALEKKPDQSFAMNRIFVQNMTKSEKKAFYAKQLEQNLAKIEKSKHEKEVQEKRAQMEQQRQQELAEKEAIEKAKAEKKEKQKEIDQKKKEKKERIKEAKRAAYLAKVEEEKKNGNANPDP